MANRKKPAKKTIDDAEDIADAVIVEDDSDPNTPEEAAQADSAKDAQDDASGAADEAVLLDEPGTDASNRDEDARDASAVDAVPDADETAQDDATPADTDTPEEATAEAEADIQEESAATDESAHEDATEAVEPQDEAPAEAVAPATPAPQPEPVVVRKGGFFPMLLGGVAAAVIGFGAARYVLPEGWPWPGAQDDTLAAQMAEANAAQDSRIDEIASAVEGIELDALAQQVSGNADTLSGLGARIEELAGTLNDVQARLDTLEARPIAEPGTPEASAFAAELRALQDSVEAQRAEIDTLLTEAQNREAAARETAQEALARAALSRIQTALDTGSDYSAALADLQDAGVSVPDALAGQSAGVATLADLSAAFPEAARAALTAARESSGEAEGLGGFLRTQLGVRSLEPKEGDSADAVLSRAEAALRDGRLTDALAEVAALPEAGQAALAEWTARAETRQSAVAAAEELAQSLTAN